MKNKLILCLIIIILPYCVWAKSQNRTFINEFTADGVTKYTTTKADGILKEEFLKARYTITDINALRAGLSTQELKMALGSNDENDLKTILASGDVDYIVYGYIRSRGNYIFITAKMLDKSGGEAKLGRVKTVNIRNEILDKHFEEACTLLAKYLMTGDTKKILQFQDQMLTEEKRYEVAKNKQRLTAQEETEYEKYQKRIEEKKEERRFNITKRDSFIRVAFNPYTITTDDEAFNLSFKEGQQFFVELDLPIFSGTFALDLIMRYTGRYFPANKEGPLSNNLPWWSTYHLDESLVADWENGYALFNAWDIGFRLRLNFYFLMTEFDIYGIGALGKNGGSFNVFGGGGVEIAFFPYIGFFMEYNRGKSAIVRGEQSINVEDNHQLLIGTVLRL